MMFSATFNNILIISWLSVSLMEEEEYPEKTTDLPQVTDKLYQRTIGPAPPKAGPELNHCLTTDL
jgi:hypothetical protein